MKRKKNAVIILIILCFALFVFLMIRSTGKIALETSSTPQKQAPILIIDAGHGGEDGGAVVGDVLEKVINLSVAQDISDLLTLCGFETRMTRTTDDALTREGADVKKRKYNDMKLRLDMYNSSDDNVILSIHQNKFTTSSSKGAQVFFSPNNERSQLLAESIRLAVKNSMQPENERSCKAAGKEIYLLKNTNNPAVLVECGFLSNSEERERLLDEGYQKQMALAVVSGFLDYYNSN